MSVYNPTGSGNVHVDRVISGGQKGRKVAKGMGFKAAAGSVAKKQGIPAKQANAIIAAGARKASPAAKKANPNLKKVTAKKAPAKKGNPFAKAMAAPMSPPGSMTGKPGSPGLGAAPKLTSSKKKAAKKAPAAMAEVGVTSARQRNLEASTAKRTTRKGTKVTGSKLPSQTRIRGDGVSSGSATTSGSRAY
jgi:hypothetical protein